MKTTQKLSDDLCSGSGSTKSDKKVKLNLKKQRHTSNNSLDNSDEESPRKALTLKKMEKSNILEDDNSQVSQDSDEIQNMEDNSPDFFNKINSQDPENAR